MLLSFRSLALFFLIAFATTGCCVAQDAAAVAASCNCEDECKSHVLKATLECNKRVETCENASLQKDEKHAATVANLKKALEEAKETAQTSMDRVNLLRKEHDDVLFQLQERMEADAAACKAAQASLQECKQQLDQTQQQVTELQNQVSMLSKQKKELEKQTESLSRDFDKTKTKLQETNDKYLDTSRNLLKQKEDYQVLLNKYSTTHVNFKLIQNDVIDMFERVRDLLQDFWKQYFAPYYNMIAKPLEPWITFLIEITGPICKSVVELIIDLYQQQVLPVWNKYVYPKIQPYLQPLLEKHSEVVASLATCIQTKSHNAYHYIKLLNGQDEDSNAIHKAVLRGLKFSDEHPIKVVKIMEQMVVLFCGFWIVVGLFALRRHLKKRAAAKASTAQHYESGLLAYANHAQKKNQ